MVKQLTLTRRVTALTAAAALTLASILPMLLNSTASALQVTNRSVSISTSEVSATGVTYTVTFTPAQTTQIDGIIVDFCQNSPLVGVDCTKTNGVSSVPTTGTFTVTQDPDGGTSGTSSVDYDAIAGTTPQTGRLILTANGGVGTGLTPSALAGDELQFSFTADNPTVLSTFYARIITYDSIANATAYDSSATGANNPGTHIDDGGSALSTADQLTVSARVQEQLEFCVAAVADPTVESDCTSGGFSTPDTEVDLGVIDSGAISRSPVAAANGGNDLTGALVIRTNAFNGATISYISEQDSGSGRLKVPAASCDATNGGATYDAGSNVVDQCFNSEVSATNFTTTDREQFGMHVASITQNGTTSNLTADANYDGISNADNYAWNHDGTADAIASSSTVLDYEIVGLEFAAQSAATTPTGSYTLTSTYVATASF